MRSVTDRSRKLRVERLEPRRMLAAQIDSVDWMGPMMASPYDSGHSDSSGNLQDLVTHFASQSEAGELQGAQTPELSKASSASCNTRHVYVMVVHGLQLTKKEQEWATRIRRDTYNYLKKAPEQYFAAVGTGSFQWDSGFNKVVQRNQHKRGAATSAFADDGYQFLRKHALDRLPEGHKLDVLMIGHSRGGVLINEVGDYLKNDPRVDYVQSIMLDPTASTQIHGDRYPQYVSSGVDYNILYHDDFTLNNKSGSGLAAALFSNIVKDQKAIAARGNASYYASLGKPIYNAIKKLPDSQQPKYGTQSYSITSHSWVQDAWRVTRLEQDLKSFLQRKDRDMSCASSAKKNPSPGTIFFDDDAPRNRNRYFYSPGESFTPRVQVVNSSAAALGELNVAYYLSSDPFVSTADLLLKSGVRAGTSINNSLDWRERLTLPSNLAAGTYYAAALARSPRGWSLASKAVEIEVAPAPVHDLTIQQVTLLGNSFTTPRGCF